MRLRVLRNSPKGQRTQGSKALQYLEEKKSNEMLLVVANENNTEQTESFLEIAKRCGVAGLIFSLNCLKQSLLKSSTEEGDSPVAENKRCMSILSRTHWKLRLNLGGINF